MMFRAVAALLIVVSSLASLPALADDWVATKLRGGVFAFVAGDWVQLRRGDIVPDRRVVRTLPNGRVTLERGAEEVIVGPDTQIEIVDRDGQDFTTVKQWYGKVEIEAEVQDVQHFAVRNPHLAAVVKGTRFVVSSDDEESEVVVKRGSVSVAASGSNDPVDVGAGESATVGNGELVVAAVNTDIGTPESLSGGPVTVDVGGPSSYDPGVQAVAPTTDAGGSFDAGEPPVVDDDDDDNGHHYGWYHYWRYLRDRHGDDDDD